MMTHAERKQRGEDVRRSNIYWTAYERLASEARVAASSAQEDMKKALDSSLDDEMRRFFNYFAGVKAREAFSFAIMALEYREKAEALR